MPNKLLTDMYRWVRRLHVIDVTRLMHLVDASTDWPVTPPGYTMQVLGDDDLRELCQSGRAPDTLADTGDIRRADRVCFAVFFGDALASYLWVARGHIEADNNFSRSSHLGTSMDLPHGTGFIYNAWTAPQHRGKRLIGVMLGYVMRHRLLGTTDLLTTMDWSNESSRRAFGHVGMQSIGFVWRIGRGRFQLTLVPSVPDVMGLRLATTAPGLIIAT